MKKFALIISLILFINTNAQIDNIAEKLGFEKDARLLIIHGDDIGVSHSVNIASFDGYKNNAINSGSAMIPSPWIKEVAEFHKQNPKYDIGLHLTLTAEWKNYKWNGVSSSNQISSLLNEDYEFYDNTSDVNEIENLISSKTKLIWVETPTNPMMNLIDIKSISKLSKQHKILLAVDNTFATPYLQKPLDLGADIVMHSATKYLNGHSDMIGGVAITNSEKIAEEIGFLHFLHLAFRTK